VPSLSSRTAVRAVSSFWKEVSPRETARPIRTAVPVSPAALKAGWGTGLAEPGSSAVYRRALVKPGAPIFGSSFLTRGKRIVTSSSGL